MELNLEHAIAVLSRTPATLVALLKELPNAWIESYEGPETWSPYDIVGHLIHGEETDWIPRARIILEHGESRPFAPFDRFAQLERFKGEPLEKLLATFTQLRQKNLTALDQLNLTPEKLELRGRHPDFGPVTMRQLLATWVVHDLNHLSQIVRVMSKQYSDAVGPWNAYLRILS